MFPIRDKRSRGEDLQPEGCASLSQMAICVAFNPISFGALYLTQKVSLLT